MSGGIGADLVFQTRAKGWDLHEKVWWEKSQAKSSFHF